MVFDRPCSPARVTELLLWAGAVLCLGTVSFAALSAFAARSEVATFVRQSSSAGRAQNGSQPGSGAEAQEPRRQAPGDVIGRLDIPQIALSVPMTAGIESSSLLRGVGHIEGTAMPGGLGTLGLAGHRDTYFRPLRRIAPGMEIRVTDHTGTYHYAIDTTEIVDPEQVDVLSIRSRPELTLITCYPFDFVGAAPRRFIVHAHLLSAAPDLVR